MEFPIPMHPRRRVVGAQFRALRGVLTIGLAAAMACYGYRRASLTPAPGTHVRVALVTSHTIATSAGTRDSTRVERQDILELSGTVVAATRDTMVVRLGEMRTSRGSLAGISEQVAFIPTNRIASVREWRIHAGKTLLASAGFLVLATSALIIALVVAVTKAAGG